MPLHASAARTRPAAAPSVVPEQDGAVEPDPPAEPAGEERAGHDPERHPAEAEAEDARREAEHADQHEGRAGDERELPAEHQGVDQHVAQIAPVAEQHREVAAHLPRLQRGGIAPHVGLGHAHAPSARRTARRAPRAPRRSRASRRPRAGSRPGSGASIGLSDWAMPCRRRRARRARDRRGRAPPRAPPPARCRRPGPAAPAPDQHAHARRQRAGEPGHRVEGEAADQHPAAAVAVGERAVDELGEREGHQEQSHGELHGRGRRAKAAAIAGSDGRNMSMESAPSPPPRSAGTRRAPRFIYPTWGSKR